MTKEEVLKAIKGTQFEADLSNPIMINSTQSSRGFWNLVCSVRDTKLFCKGIKAHRNWRLKDVKWYFGVNGGKEKVAKTLELYKVALFGE